MFDRVISNRNKPIPKAIGGGLLNRIAVQEAQKAVDKSTAKVVANYTKDKVPKEVTRYFKE